MTMFGHGEGMDKNGVRDDSTLFQTVTKQRLVDRVVADIQDLIVQGKLAVGAKLPPERELAELFGVSRTVIREAVRILVTKGLLESKHGIGTMVRQGRRDQLVEPLGWLLQRNDATLDDLHEVRTILEVEIAAEAATRATAEDIAQLGQVVEHAAIVRADPAAFAASDAEFHQLLAGILRNAMLSVLLDSIRALMSDIRLKVSRNSEFDTIVLADHAAILEAVRARDSAQARAAMQTHLVHARAFQRALEQEIGPKLLG
jgi:GntR family transcriptional regulator, transcriptional repressor for pyruvate dehydrogenase complex